MVREPHWSCFVTDATEECSTSLPVETRKQNAVEFLNSIDDFDITIWTDGSVKNGTEEGGSGAVVITLL